MKLSILFISLITLNAFATGGGPEASQRIETRDKMKSQKGLEERRNNASVIIGTGSGTASDGYGTTDKDTRPQGKKHNADYSDTDVKTNDE